MYNINDLTQFLNKLVKSFKRYLKLIISIQGRVEGQQIFNVTSVNNTHPFKDEIEIKKKIEAPIVIKMSNQIAYQLGFLSFVEVVSQKEDICSIKIETDIYKISSNLIINLLNLKIVSNMFASQNCQILCLQITEAELCSILLGTKPFLYRNLNRKIQLKFCNPQMLHFKVLDIFDNCIFFKYAKISLDFRKNVKFKR